MPPASASTSSAARSSASRPSRRDAEQGEHAPERRARAHRAEQVLAVRDGVPADHDLVVDRLRHALAVERRDRAHERLGGAPGVEHLALADRAGADRGAQVVVAADREHRAARPRQRVADRAQRRARERRLGQQARPARPTTRASRPTTPRACRSSQPVREASESSAPCSPPRPCTIHSPTLSQRTPRARLGHVVAQPAVLRRPCAARAATGPVVAAEALGADLARQPRRLLLAARVVPGDRRDHRLAARSSSTPVSAMLDTPTPATRPSGRAGERLARRRERARREALRRRSRRRSGPCVQCSGAWPCAISSPVRRDHGRLARRRPEVEPQQQLRGHGANASPRGAGAPRGRRPAQQDDL